MTAVLAGVAYAAILQAPLPKPFSQSPQVFPLKTVGRDYETRPMFGSGGARLLSPKEAAHVLSNALGKRISESRLVPKNARFPNWPDDPLELGPTSWSNGFLAHMENNGAKPSLATVRLSTKKEVPVLVCFHVLTARPEQFMADTPSGRRLFRTVKAGYHRFDLVLISDRTVVVPLKFGKATGNWTFLGVEIWRLK